MASLSDKSTPKFPPLIKKSLASARAQLQEFKEHVWDMYLVEESEEKALELRGIVRDIWDLEVILKVLGGKCRRL